MDGWCGWLVWLVGVAGWCVSVVGLVWLVCPVSIVGAAFNSDMTGKQLLCTYMCCHCYIRTQFMYYAMMQTIQRQAFRH